MLLLDRLDRRVADANHSLPSFSACHLGIPAISTSSLNNVADVQHFIY